MTRTTYLPSIAAAATAIVFATLPAMASAKTCAEELPEIEAQIPNVEQIGDRNVAEHQLGRAKERLAAGKEKSCLRYLQSARAAIEAAQMHDD